MSCQHSAVRHVDQRKNMRDLQAQGSKRLVVNRPLSAAFASLPTPRLSTYLSIRHLRLKMRAAFTALLAVLPAVFVAAQSGTADASGAIQSAAAVREESVSGVLRLPPLMLSPILHLVCPLLRTVSAIVELPYRRDLRLFRMCQHMYAQLCKLLELRWCRQHCMFTATRWAVTC